MVSLRNAKNQPIVFKRDGVNLYERIRMAQLVTVRKTELDTEKKIVNEYRKRTNQIDGIESRRVHPRDPLTYGHLGPVPAGEWLNDDVVNFYLDLLQKEHPDVQMQTSFFFDKLLGVAKRTAFRDGKVICIETDVTQSNEIPEPESSSKSQRKKMTTHTHDLNNYDYKHVKRWSKNRPFVKKRLLFVPINVKNSHWVASAGKLGNLLLKDVKVST